MLKQFKRYRWTMGLAVLFLGWILFGPRIIENVLNGESAQVDIIAGVPEDADLTGRLLFTQNADGILQFDFATATTSTYWMPDDGGLINGITASPDGTQLIIAYAPPVNSGIVGNADLYVMDVETQTLTEFLMREETAESFRNPHWSRDGEWLYFTHYQPLLNDNGATVGITLDIQRTAIDGDGTIETIASGSEQPALSADGTQLTYLGYDTSTYLASVWLADADGLNAVELIPSGTFAILGSPRFAPDGEAVCFSASGEIQDTSSLFAPNIAYAHGAPWEIWCVDLDGSDLRQLTQGIFDDVMLTYPPDDGDTIAFIDAKTLYVLFNEDIYSLATISVRGELVWLPE